MEIKYVGVNFKIKIKKWLINNKNLLYYTFSLFLAFSSRKQKAPGASSPFHFLPHSISPLPPHCSSLLHGASSLSWCCHLRPPSLLGRRLLLWAPARPGSPLPAAPSAQHLRRLPGSLRSPGWPAPGRRLHPGGGGRAVAERWRRGESRRRRRPKANPAAGGS